MTKINDTIILNVLIVSGFTTALLQTSPSLNYIWQRYNTGHDTVFYHSVTL